MMFPVNPANHPWIPAAPLKGVATQPKRPWWETETSKLPMVLLVMFGWFNLLYHPVIRNLWKFEYVNGLDRWWCILMYLIHTYSHKMGSIKSTRLERNAQKEWIKNYASRKKGYDELVSSSAWVESKSMFRKNRWAAWRKLQSQFS